MGLVVYLYVAENRNTASFLVESFWRWCKVNVDLFVLCCKNKYLSVAMNGVTWSIMVDMKLKIIIIVEIMIQGDEEKLWTHSTFEHKLSVKHFMGFSASYLPILLMPIIPNPVF